MLPAPAPIVRKALTEVDQHLTAVEAGDTAFDWHILILPAIDVCHALQLSFPSSPAVRVATNAAIAMLSTLQLPTIQ